MHGRWFLALLVLAPLPVRAQPTDCAPAPPAGPSLPLSLGLAGRPGVPNGLTGKVYVQVPTDPPPPEECWPEPPPPRDVLGGEPGDVLHGPPSPDLLRGPGTPHVEVETLPPPR